MAHWGRYWGPHQPVCLVCLLLLCLHGRPSACPMSPQFVFICVVMSQSSAPTTGSQESTTPLSQSDGIKRNKETTRSTSDCLQWAVGEGIGEHFRLTDASGEGRPGKLYCNLCAIWLSSKGAVLKDHVLGKNKNSAGEWERQPGSHPLGALNDIKSAQAEVTRGKFPPGVQKLLSACPAPQAAAQSKVLQQAATVMSSKVDNLHAKTIKGRGKTQTAVNCFNPELLQTKEMMSYSELCKHIPNVPQSEWVRYIALPAPSPLPDSTAARVAWWHAKKDDFPVLSSIAVFFVRRPRSACHVERTFSLMGHIQTKDRLHMGNDTLRYLAMMYVKKPTTDDPDGESD